MRGLGRTIVVTAIACAILAPGPASGQEQCSCTDKDPATAVTLQITAAVPEDHSRIGARQETLVVDLRGTETVLVGEAPELLEEVDLADVPVLMTVGEAVTEDECTGERPAAGSDLSLTGQVYMEETGPVVWTGPCQGSLTVVAAPAGAEAADAPDEGTWEDGLVVAGAVLAALALLCLVLALTAGANPLVDDVPASDESSDEPGEPLP